MEVNIHHAKTNLSRLIVRAEAGEEVVIARAGKPAVKLVPVVAHQSKTRKLKAGALKGLVVMHDDSFAPDPELESLFYDGPIFPDQKPGEVVTVNVSPRFLSGKKSSLDTPQIRRKGAPTGTNGQRPDRPNRRAVAAR